MTDERLLATCWTTAGDANPLPGDQRSPVPIRERVEAAAAAGFRGFGLLHADLMPALDQYGVRGLRALLDDHGLVDLELELITGWWTADSTSVRRDLLRAAEALGARHIKIAPDVTDGPWNRDEWVAAFAALADEAALAGRLPRPVGRRDPLRRPPGGAAGSSSQRRFPYGVQSAHV